jgi:hypothetical protein
MGRGAGRAPPHDANLGPVQAAAMIGTGKEANEIRTVADMSQPFKSIVPIHPKRPRTLCKSSFASTNAFFCGSFMKNFQ